MVSASFVVCHVCVLLFYAIHSYSHISVLGFFVK